MAKHMFFLSEGAEAMSLLIKHVESFHRRLVEKPPQASSAASFTILTHEDLKQKSVQCEVWKLRMTSLQQRMQNIINLVGHDLLSAALCER